MDSEQFLLEIYKEENAHARHTEVQRLEVTKFLLVLAGAFVALMGALKFSIYCLPFGVLIIFLGMIGAKITDTYVTRFDDHRRRARAMRAQIDSMTKPPNVAMPIVIAHPISTPPNSRVRSFWTQISYSMMALGIVCVACNLCAVYARAAGGPLGTPLRHRIAQQLILTS
jgi:hypothetical protein